MIGHRQRRMALAILMAGAASPLLSACKDPTLERSTEARRKALIGLWQREFDADYPTIRQTLNLGADGQFLEIAEDEPAGAEPQREVWSGEWTYDGTNLKRRYLRKNGQLLIGATLHYATFTLISVSPEAFVVDDNFVKHLVSFQRLAADATR